VLLLPADMLLERVKSPSSRQAHLGTYPLDRSIADPTRIAKAADLIAKATQPLVVAGGGVHLSGASAEVAALQADVHLPVMTTVMGKGAVDETHPLSLGVAGYNLGHLAPARYLRPLIERADVVLLIGTRTNQNGTDSWALYPDGATYIHIDVDPAEVGRNYEALRLVGDARLTLAALIERLRGQRKPDADLGKAIAEARAKHAREVAPLMQSEASPVHPIRMMADMQQVLGPDTIVVADASYATLWVACYLKALRAGQRFVTPRGLAGLGWGLPLALGARMAQPDKPVLCLVGDGGFAHVWSELETARRMRAKVVLTVLNNGVLAYQKDAEDVKFGRHTTACYFTPVDHAQIAGACGCRGVRVERPAEYLPALRAALAADETTVIDVITDPQAYPPITLFDEKLDRVRDERNT
jgi:acetolactate synthase-1/2/3 large subunit